MQDKPHLICVGCYDGSVAVYNLATPNEANRAIPTHKSTALTGKHTDPVWQVKWQPDDLDKRHNFFSVSADSLVRGWTMVKNELHFRDVIELEAAEVAADDDDMEATKYAGICFAFNPTQDHLYLVGTEEGKIMKCSKAYNAKFLTTYEAHGMAVYGLKWNSYHDGVFVSCSADWSVKVWDHEYPLSLFEFDLGAAVGDVAWAPFSSTLFAAVCANGFLHIFDLAISKTEAVHVSQIIKKGKLTHVSFNSEYPVLVLGDDRGNVTSFKLSPNLRKNFAVRDTEVEVEKLNKLLESMKELDIQTGKPLYGTA
jgi:dynein intermediate chain 1